MATLPGQRANFTWALNQYGSTDDPEKRAHFARLMAKTIADAPANGFTTEQVTQGQSYPVDEVAQVLSDPIVAAEPAMSEAASAAALSASVDQTDAVREGQGSGSVYAYGYRCAPDRLKVGMTKGDTVERIAAQIATSTPDRPVLVLEVRTDACHMLERAIHAVLEARGRKVQGGGAEWFKTTREEVLDICRFVAGTT